MPLPSISYINCIGKLIIILSTVIYNKKYCRKFQNLKTFIIVTFVMYSLNLIFRAIYKVTGERTLNKL